MGFLSEPLNDETAEFMLSARKACEKLAEMSSTPIYVEQNGQARLAGTGVLLQLSDTHFVVTAAHTFSRAKVANVPIWFPGVTPGSMPLPQFHAELHMSASNDPVNREDDPFDVCVFEVPSNVAEELKKGKRFLRAADLDALDKQNLRSFYLVFGYPFVQNPPVAAGGTITANALSYGTFVYGNERGAATRHDPAIGIVLDGGGESTRNDAGEREDIPHPGGMSGCGIWRMVTADAPLGRWKPEDIRLVGHQHAYDKTLGILRGTRIRYTLQLIARNYPELRNVIEGFLGQVGD
jgi:hypothetical protein